MLNLVGTSATGLIVLVFLFLELAALMISC